MIKTIFFGQKFFLQESEVLESNEIDTLFDLYFRQFFGKRFFNLHGRAQLAVSILNLLFCGG